MTGLVDLSPVHLATVEGILAEHVPDCEVRAFGSRAKWSARDASDLDLAVVGDGPLPSRTLTMLQEAFEESRLPMRVDVVDWNAIADSFRESIDSDSVVVQKAPERTDWSTVALGDVVELTLSSVDKKSKAVRRVAEAEHASLVDGSGGHHGDAWPVQSIQDMCLRVTSGGTPSRRQPSFYEDGCWPWLKTQELRDGWIDDAEEHITDDAVASSSAKVLPENTVLMAMYGATVGRLGILRSPMTCNQACCAMIVDPGRADYRYLFYQLLHARARIKNLATGAAQQNLSGQLIKSLKFPFPPLPKQRRIARVLSTLDDKIELNRRMSETLEEMARALFISWFVDFDPVRAKAEGRPSGLPPDLDVLFPASFEESELGEIPEGWEVKKLREVSHLNPESWSRTNSPDHVEYVDLSNTKWGTIESTQHFLWKDAPSRARRILRSGDTIVGTVRPGNGSYSFIGNDGLTGSTGFAVLRPLHPRFRELVYLSVTAPGNIDWLAHQADGAAYPAVRPEIVSETKVAFPNVEPDMLDWFSTLVGTPLNNMEIAKMESRTLSAFRDTLLPKLISGEIRVQDVEKVVESVP